MIAFVQLREVVLTSAGKRVTSLAPGVDGVSSLEEHRLGIMADGRHLFPWGIVGRVDYSKAAAGPEESPLPDPPHVGKRKRGRPSKRD